MTKKLLIGVCVLLFSLVWTGTQSAASAENQISTDGKIAIQPGISSEESYLKNSKGCIFAREKRGTRCNSSTSLEITLTLGEYCPEKVYYNVYYKRTANSQWTQGTGGTVYANRETVEYFCDEPYDYEIREQ